MAWTPRLSNTAEIICYSQNHRKQLISNPVAQLRLDGRNTITWVINEITYSPDVLVHINIDQRWNDIKTAKDFRLSENKSRVQQDARGRPQWNLAASDAFTDAQDTPRNQLDVQLRNLSEHRRKPRWRPCRHAWHLRRLPEPASGDGGLGHDTQGKRPGWGLVGKGLSAEPSPSTVPSQGSGSSGTTLRNCSADLFVQHLWNWCGYL